MSNISKIPNQTPVPWGIAFKVSVAGVRRRLLRSFITMSGVILAIAFLAYMLMMDNLNTSMVDMYFAAESSDLQAELLTMLHEASVDPHTTRGGTDRRLMLLIGLSLIICLVGIINAMLMAVTERVKEIGTLKCLGAMDSFIVKSYFIESSLQGIMGTLLGMTIGAVIALLMALQNYGMMAITMLPIMDIVMSLLIAFVIGSGISIGAAIGPAYFAAKKQPVEAMRVEE